MRQQNGRLADQQLSQSLKLWQARQTSRSNSRLSALPCAASWRRTGLITPKAPSKKAREASFLLRSFCLSTSPRRKDLGRFGKAFGRCTERVIYLKEEARA